MRIIAIAFAVCIAAVPTILVLTALPSFADSRDEFCAGFEEGYLSVADSMSMVPMCPLEPLTDLGSTPYRMGIKAGIAAALRN